jgi:predicted nucleotidyltransferase
LFGSVAREEADRFSYIDIIIVYPTKNRSLDRLEELYPHWNIDRAVDILAYTSEEQALEQLMVVCRRFLAEKSISY